MCSHIHTCTHRLGGTVNVRSRKHILDMIEAYNEGAGEEAGRIEDEKSQEEKYMVSEYVRTCAYMNIHTWQRGRGNQR